MARTPLRWVGGKARSASTIAACMPAHTVYVEPFGGAASVLLAKRPSKIEVYNDVDRRLTDWWRALQDRDTRADLIDRLMYTPYSSVEYDRAWDTLRSADATLADRAWALFVVNRMGFGAVLNHKTGFGRSITQSMPRTFAGAVALIEAAADRLRNVTIECRDWRGVVDDWCRGSDCVVYLDPPYHPDALTGCTTYSYDADRALHAQIVDWAIAAPCTVLLSGYQCDAYAPLQEAGYSVVTWHQPLSVARTRTGQRRTECLWIRVQDGKILDH